MINLNVNLIQRTRFSSKYKEGSFAMASFIVC